LRAVRSNEVRTAQLPDLISFPRIYYETLGAFC
jgi:hypothetical protein